MKDFTSWWKSHSVEIHQAWALMWKIVQRQTATVFAWLKVIWTNVVSVFHFAWDLIVNIVKVAWALISDEFTAGMHFVMNLFAVIIDIMTGHWSKAWQDIKKLVSQGLSDIWHLIKDVGSKFGTLLWDAGKDLVRGLINGVKSMAGAVGSTLSNLAHNAMDSFKSVLGIKSPSRVFHQFGIWINEGLANGLTGSLSKIRSALSKTENMLLDLAKGKKLRGLEHYVTVEGAQLIRLANQRDSVAKRLKSAQAALKKVQDEWTSTRNDVAQNIVSGASIVMQSQDDGAAISAGDVVANLQNQVQQATQFAANLEALKRKHLRADLVQQIAAAGVDQGGATAQALLGANSAQIAQINGLQKQLNLSAQGAGATVANSMFGAGLNAAKGLVKGLQSQESAIEKQMVRIAKSMEKALKHALGIKSPSRVFHELGRYVSAGLVGGVDSGNRDVEAAAGRMASALLRGSDVPSLSGSAVSTGMIQHNVHIEVHGSVRSDRDLRDVIQQEMYRYGGRNSVTWQQFKR
jgi:hypothetical protein